MRELVDSVSSDEVGTGDADAVGLGVIQGHSVGEQGDPGRLIGGRHECGDWVGGAHYQVLADDHSVAIEEGININRVAAADRGAGLDGDGHFREVDVDNIFCSQGMTNRQIEGGVFADGIAGVDVKLAGLTSDFDRLHVGGAEGVAGLNRGIDYPYRSSRVGVLELGVDDQAAEAQNDQGDDGENQNDAWTQAHFFLFYSQVWICLLTGDFQYSLRAHKAQGVKVVA